jgi:hypothetical protein
MIPFDEIERIGEAAVVAYLKVGLPSRNLPTGTEKIHGQNNQRPDPNDVMRYNMFTVQSYLPTPQKLQIFLK